LEKHETSGVSHEPEWFGHRVFSADSAATLTGTTGTGRKQERTASWPSVSSVLKKWSW